jgi:hypothetical protein
MIYDENGGRRTLGALSREHTPEEYTNMVWQLRYPSPSPNAAKIGWPVKRIADRPFLLIKFK